MNHLKNMLYAIILLLIIDKNLIANETMSPEITLLLHELHDSVKDDDYQQIDNAIRSSGRLQVELDELINSHLFTGFLVLPREKIKNNKARLFGGFIESKKIILTTELLEELRKFRLFDVAYSDDVLPNNTIFVLSHLLYHIKNPIDMNKYHSPSEFVDAMLQIEAAAYIEAWNSMVIAAEGSNNRKSLTVKQLGQVLMNARYKFIFINAMKHKEAPLQLTPEGLIEANDTNVMAIVIILKNSRMMDIE